MRVFPATLNGKVSVPTSKSMAHRYMICAALAQGTSFLRNITFSHDVLETLHVINSLGVTVQNHGIRDLYIKNESLAYNKKITCNVKESASTLRLMIPVLAALGVEAKYNLGERLANRPLDVYMDILPKFGVNLKKSGTLLSVHGCLKPGKFLIKGNVSSQFVSGLLLALPILQANSEIIIDPPLQSRPYVDMTCEVMSDFGVQVKKTDRGFALSGNQRYNALEKIMEGDWSAAAFWALLRDVCVDNVNMNSIQGDKKCVDLFKKIQSVDLSCDSDNLVQIDASDIPDLVPILSVAAGISSATVRIINISRLRDKESDRINSVVTMLFRFGVSVLESQNDIVVHGRGRFCGKTVIDGYNDHRIVMAAAIAGLYADNFIDITDPFSVCKSYPNFWDDYRNLGGIADVVDLR